MWGWGRGDDNGEEGQLRRCLKATHDFYQLFMIWGAWGEVGEVFSLPPPLAAGSSLTGCGVISWGQCSVHGRIVGTTWIFCDSFSVVGFSKILSMK